MAVKSYSTTASSNTSVNAVSIAEGMAPSGVNNAMREICADIRSEVATKGSDIASAATVDLDDATGDFIDVSGTTTITSLGTVSAGIRRTIRFTGALTLTHNGTSLILPGGANITTANGDIARFRSLGSGNWVCEFYSKASGEAIDDSNYAKLDADNTFTSTDAGATGPGLNLHHDSASPAADDTIGAINLKGNNDAAEETIYARLRAVLADATDGSEDGRLSIDAMTAGALTAVLHLAQGLLMEGATGGDPGAGKINATGYEANGTALPFQKAYESGNQTITSGGSLTLAHGLGVQPKLYKVFLKCLSSSGGYSTGDEVLMEHMQGTDTGVSVVPDATNLNIRYGSATNPFTVVDKSNGNQVSAANASWRAIFRAWA